MSGEIDTHSSGDPILLRHTNAHLNNLGSGDPILLRHTNAHLNNLGSGDPILLRITNAHLNNLGSGDPILIRHTKTCGFSFTFIILNNYWGRDECFVVLQRQYFCRTHRESEPT